MLDAIDKKVLLALINNARLSISAISKETKLSREIVNYRISKLEQDGLITGYIARISQPLFCTGIALMECKLIRSNPSRYSEIIQFVQSHPSINWCAELCGTYDLALTILYNTPLDLANTITEISNFIGKNLKENEVSLYIDEYKFNRSGLITEKITIAKKEVSSTFDKNITENIPINKNFKLDKTDLSILKILSSNCRTKNVDISKNLKISEDIVRLRIRNIEKKGIINGYTLSIDAEKLGYEAYQIGLQIEQMTNEIVHKVKYYAQSNPYIVFCVRTSGKNNIILNIHAKNRLHFNQILLDIRNNLSEISEYEFQMNMKTYKEVFVPEQKISLITK